MASAPATEDLDNNRKRRAEDDPEGGPAKKGAETPKVQFRILCPVHKIGSIIGKGGEIISRIRQETGAWVKVGDMVHGCQERVVMLSSPTVENEQQLVPAQSAVLAVIERLCAEDKQQDDESRKLSFRVLIDRSQTGPMLGKGGSVITKMRQESGAIIRIRDRREVPPCADANEDLLEISGEYDDCRQAALLVTQRLREFPPSRLPGSQSGGPPGPPRGPPGPPPGMGYPPSMPHHHHHHANPGMPPPMPYSVDNPSLSTEGYTGEIETVYRMLCPGSSIGCIIGKGGDVVKRVRAETGARLKVMDATPGCDERVVHCSSHEDVHSPVVAAIDALLRCIHNFLSDSADKAAAHGHDPSKQQLRMLVPANQIGAVLGKAGSTIKQIRSDTGAHLVVLPRDQTPACGDTRNDEVLVVEGGHHSIMQAMACVASLLRNNMIRTQGVQFMAGGGPGAMPITAYPPPPYHTAVVPQHPGLAPVPMPVTLVSAQPGMAGMQLAPGTVVDINALAQQGYQVVSVQGGAPTAVQLVAPGSLAPAQQVMPAAALAQPGAAPPAAAGAPAPQYTYVQTTQTWQPGADPGSAQVAGVPAAGQPAGAAAAYPGAPGSYAPPATSFPPAANPYPGPPATYTTPGAAPAAYSTQPPGYSAPPTSFAYSSAPPAASMPLTPGAAGQPSPGAAPAAGTYNGTLAFGGAASAAGQPGAGGPTSPGGGPTSSVRLLIASHQVGPLLGRSGSNIQHVRQVSGARLKLHEISGTAGERELEITGAPDQIAEAQRMVSEILSAAQHLPPSHHVAAAHVTSAGAPQYAGQYMSYAPQPSPQYGTALAGQYAPPDYAAAQAGQAQYGAPDHAGAGQQHGTTTAV